MLGAPMFTMNAPIESYIFENSILKKYFNLFLFFLRLNGVEKVITTILKDSVVASGALRIEQKWN